MRTLPAALALALLVLAPTALAAPVEGDLRFPRGASLAGRLLVEARDGGLDLAEAVRAGAPLEASWARATSHLVTLVDDRATVAGYQVFLGTQEPANRTREHGPARLANLSCVAACKAFVVAPPGAPSWLSLEGEADGPLRWLVEDRVVYSGFAAKGRDAFHHEFPAGSLNFTSRPEGAPDALRLEGAVAAASGHLGLVLWGVSGEFVSDDGRVETFETGYREVPEYGPGGVQTGERGENSFLAVWMHDALVAPAAGAPVDLVAPLPSLRLDGRLLAASAEGRLVVDGEPRDLAGEGVRVEGAIGLAPHAEVLRVGDVSPGAQDAPLRATLRGDATKVVVSGETLHRERALAAPVAAGVTLLLLALAAPWLKTGLAPLYTRIARSRVLANANRRRVYDALVERPGLTTADLVRATGLAEVVVRHHLRMLETHRFVRLQRSGRLKAYFATDGGTDPAAAAARLALHDGTRGRIAAEVARSGRLTRRDLAARLGISPRLVSYHLQKLEEAGLVAAHGGLPREYAPTPRLSAFLAQETAASA